MPGYYKSALFGIFICILNRFFMTVSRQGNIMGPQLNIKSIKYECQCVSELFGMGLNGFTVYVLSFIWCNS